MATQKKAKVALRKVNLGKEMTFPVQMDDEVAFVDTLPQDIMSAAKPGELKEKISTLKEGFAQEIHKIAGEHDLNMLVRVYFTVLPKKE